MCQSGTQCRIFLALLGCIGLSVLACVPMFILTHPGDECLLFVSVRGEALIYGNPAGCHFIAYGHGCVIVGALIMSFLLFFPHRRKGFVKRDLKDTPSNRSLPGTLPEQMSNGIGQSSMSMNSRHIIGRIYSTKVILLCTCLTMFTVVMATVVLSGYLVSCDELAYETRRQLYGRTTLGTPIKNLEMACYSLFRDVDFHTRFHFDHYEYSSNWHGQYRHYKHGRVHQYSSKHEHIIPVAAALEMSLGGTWIGALLWCVLLGILIYQRCIQKRQQNRELAESIEDARIYASSRDGVMMHPMDQMSVTSSSHQSSVLTQKPQMSMNPSIIGSNSMMSPTPLPHGHHNGSFDQQSPQSQVQYVQLANGVLVPMSSLPPQQQQQVSQNTYAQLQFPPPQAYPPQVHASHQHLGYPPQAMEPPLATSQSHPTLVGHGVQYNSNGFLPQQPNGRQPLQTNGGQPQQAMVDQPYDLQKPVINQMDRSPRASPMPSSYPLPPATSIQNLTKSPGMIRANGNASRSRRMAAQPIEELEESETLNSRSAQELQLHLSSDLGMKCSQI